MERVEEFLAALDYSLNTRRKRHIAGGVLMSISLLFGGIAITIMTLKNEEDEQREKYIE